MAQSPYFQRLVLLPTGEQVPVDQAMNQAITLHQQGKVRRAGDMYRRILFVAPDHADAQHLFGITKRQRGDYDEAIKYIQAAIEINPGAAMYHSNLCELYRTTGDFDKAEAACREALRLDPKMPEAHLNMAALDYAREQYDSAASGYEKAVSLREGYVDALLGLGDCRIKTGLTEKALGHYETILSYLPDNVAALTRKGIALRMLDRIDEAIEHYKKAVERLPDEPDLYNNLALLYQRQGNHADAAECLRKLLQLSPGDVTARHLLNALEGDTTEAAPTEYVREVFDNYAKTFETHLIDKLGYHTPELLARAIFEMTAQRKDLSVLDLGCGTGLMGEQLKDACAHLSGVDLAPKMIDEARAKNIYHDLAVGDVVEFMGSKDDATYDIVVAADVFVYIGGLDSIYAQAKRLLPKGGIFAFSVEANEEKPDNFYLKDTGRYGHSKEYLRALQEKHGFIEKHLSREHIRNQNKQPIYGYLCVYQVPA